MPVEWALSIVAQIFKGKGDIRNCSCYRAVRLLEHGMKVEERVLDKRLHRIVSIDGMQFGFMPERGTIDAVFILRRLHEEYHAKGKKIVYVLCGPREIFDIVPRKVLEWALRKKEMLEVLVRSVMSLCHGAKTRVWVDSELSEELEVNVVMQQGSVQSPFLFSVVIDVIPEFARECAVSELLYADDLVLMSETIKGLRNKFL